MTKLYKVTLRNGSARMVKCDTTQTDGRRIYFLKDNGTVIRSWLLDNVWSWEEVRDE